MIGLMQHSPCTVLVAEDDRASQLIAVQRLRRLGYSAEVVTNGRAAVEAVSRHGAQFDLILMDCHMPVMDGFNAAQAIRRTEGQMRHIPIVAMTAGGDRQSCLAAGMDDYISKPCSGADLERVLGRWMPRQVSAPPVSISAA